MSEAPAPAFEGYVYGGARALVELHDRHLRSFVDAWKRARDDVALSVDAYVDALLRAWDGPLRGLGHREADQGVYPSRWGTEYCIDAMLEHAVMHPIRHELQLERART